MGNSAYLLLGILMLVLTAGNLWLYLKTEKKTYLMWILFNFGFFVFDLWAYTTHTV